jgi:hypothetical protein
MGSREAARVRCWQRWQGSQDAPRAGGGGMPQRPPRHGAKDFLGAAATLAIVGAILLFLTNGVAAHCAATADPRTGTRVCTGAVGVAAHIRGIMTLGVLACGVLAVGAFIWYIFWGYKTNGPAGEPREGGGGAGGH